MVKIVDIARSRNVSQRYARKRLNRTSILAIREASGKIAALYDEAEVEKHWPRKKSGRPNSMAAGIESVILLEIESLAHAGANERMILIRLQEHGIIRSRKTIKRWLEKVRSG